MIEPGILVQYKKHASFLRQIFSDKEGHNRDYISKIEHLLGDRSTGIYMIYNNITGDYYIGSSLDIHKRRIVHTRTMKSDKWISGNKLIRRHYKKYGEGTFIFIKLHVVPEKYLSEVEDFWIKELDPFYNIARRSIRYIKSKDSRNKTSDYSKNRRDNSIYKVPVLQYDKNMVLIKEWASIKEAQEGIGITSGHISTACRTFLKNGKKRLAFGYYWEYKNGMTAPKKRYK